MRALPANLSWQLRLAPVDWDVMPRFIGTELQDMGLIEVRYVSVPSWCDKGNMDVEPRWRLTRKGQFQQSELKSEFGPLPIESGTATIDGRTS